MHLFIISIILALGTPTSLYDFKIKSIDGNTIDLSKFRGKKVLIVNTASECGYTPQYKGLEELHEKFEGKLVIIGFPSNDFGGQEPGTNAEIKAFCAKNYEVKFLLSAKVSINGDDIDPFFSWLIEQPNPDFTGPVKWNFEKFLFDENGVLIHRYRTKMEPMNEIILKDIQL